MDEERRAGVKMHPTRGVVALVSLCFFYSFLIKG